MTKNNTKLGGNNNNGSKEYLNTGREKRFSHPLAIHQFQSSAIDDKLKIIHNLKNCHTKITLHTKVMKLLRIMH